MGTFTSGWVRVLAKKDQLTNLQSCSDMTKIPVKTSIITQTQLDDAEIIINEYMNEYTEYKNNRIKFDIVEMCPSF